MFHTCVYGFFCSDYSLSALIKGTVDDLLKTMEDPHEKAIGKTKSVMLRKKLMSKKGLPVDLELRSGFLLVILTFGEIEHGVHIWDGEAWQRHPVRAATADAAFEEGLQIFGDFPIEQAATRTCIVSGHGMGVTNRSTDRMCYFDGDGGITPARLVATLRQWAHLHQKFEILAMDACLMQMIEMPLLLAGSVDFYIASQMPIKGKGAIDLHKLLLFLMGQIRRPEEIATRMLEIFNETYATTNPDRTFSCIETTRSHNVIPLLESVARRQRVAFRETSDRWNPRFPVNGPGVPPLAVCEVFTATPSYADGGPGGDKGRRDLLSLLSELAGPEAPQCAAAVAGCISGQPVGTGGTGVSICTDMGGRWDGEYAVLMGHLLPEWIGLLQDVSEFLVHRRVDALLA